MACLACPGKDRMRELPSAMEVSWDKFYLQNDMRERVSEKKRETGKELYFHQQTGFCPLSQNFHSKEER